MDNWTKIPSKEVIEQTVAALKANNIEAFVVENAEEAKKKVLSIIPEGSEVFPQTSKTLDAIGIPAILNESGKYDSVRTRLNSMDRTTQSREMRKLGAAPDFAIGSVHALTQDGNAMIASNTGSQLPAYVYGAGVVIWVVGAQKIVKNKEEGNKRIYEHVLPLEAERANKAYNITTGSFVSKLLIVNREVNPERIKIIIVKEVLGF